jgi:aspartyl protease family protein
MDISPVAELVRAQPLLALALGAMALVMIGGLMRRPMPIAGGAVRGIGNIGLIFALLLTIAQVARISPGLDISLPQMGLPEQEVSGDETRIRMARDGHFWVPVLVNGVDRRFLVDTGATLTAVSPETAQLAILLKTANGTSAAHLASLEELRVGNALARNLDAVIAPGLGDTNVLGMNFLSRLKSWRVEDGTLILVPNHPQAVD